jgi:hypothetical protein
MAQSLRLRFKDGLLNLHDVGYFSVDIYQLIAFSEALAAGDVAEAERWFGEKSRPFNRFASVLERYARKSNVTDARRGSIELEIAVASLAATIVVPLVQVYVQRAIGNRDINFEIGVDDQVVRRAIDAYAAGAFGQGPRALEGLYEHLRQRERDVKLIGDNSLLIDGVLTRYAKRMIRTIKRP